MIKLRVESVREIHTSGSVELAGQEIVSLLKAAGYNVPKDANVTVRIPGGGDYSNCHLDIDYDCPVHVTWNVVTTEQPMEAKS